MNWHCFQFDFSIIFMEKTNKLFLSFRISVFIWNSNPIRFIGILFSFLSIMHNNVFVWPKQKKIGTTIFLLVFFFFNFVYIYRNCYCLIYHFIYILRILVVHSVNDSYLYDIEICLFCHPFWPQNQPWHRSICKNAVSASWLCAFECKTNF